MKRSGRQIEDMTRRRAAEKNLMKFLQIRDKVLTFAAHAFDDSTLLHHAHHTAACYDFHLESFTRT